MIGPGGLFEAHWDRRFSVLVVHAYKDSAVGFHALGNMAACHEVRKSETFLPIKNQKSGPTIDSLPVFLGIGRPEEHGELAGDIAYAHDDNHSRGTAGPEGGR